MEQRLTELMRVNLGHPEQFELLPDHAYAQAIMCILQMRFLPWWSKNREAGGVASEMLLLTIGIEFSGLRGHSSVALLKMAKRG